jgi:hypothetical protein
MMPRLSDRKTPVTASVFMIVILEIRWELQSWLGPEAMSQGQIVLNEKEKKVDCESSGNSVRSSSSWLILQKYAGNVMTLDDKEKGFREWNRSEAGHDRHSINRMIIKDLFLSSSQC